MKEPNPCFEEVQTLLQEAESTSATDRQRSQELAEQSLAICRTLNNPFLLAQALDLAGRARQSIGGLVEAKALIEEALSLRQDLGDQNGTGESLRNLSNVSRWIGDFEEAEKLIRQSMAIFTELHDAPQLALSARILHGALVYGGKFTESVRLFEEPATIYQDFDLLPKPDAPSIVSAFGLMHLGRYDEAEERFQKTLAIYPKTSIGYAVKNLGRIALVRGKYDEAEQHLLEALTLFREAADPNGLGQTLGCLGMTALRLGNQTQAQEYIQENLALAAKTLIILPSMTALSSAALLCAEEGDAGKAIELYTVALQSGHVVNSRWYHDVIGESIDMVADALPSAAVQAAKERGRKRTWQALLQDYL